MARGGHSRHHPPERAFFQIRPRVECSVLVLGCILSRMFFGSWAICNGMQDYEERLVLAEVLERALVELGVLVSTSPQTEGFLRLAIA